MLYELLTGTTPFDAKTSLAAGLDEMRRIIREQEPLRPSTKLRKTQQAERGPGRQSAIGSPQPAIDSDLDWIVMKCLEKDRARRYQTANGLARDIERHLQHEPVMARPPSMAYRIQKFVRRNKVIVMAGTAVAATLVLGMVVSLWQAVRASQQRARAEAKEMLARQQAYAADMKIADTARRENNLGQAMSALRRHIPKPGEADLRGIEWRYLWQKCQGQQSAVFRHESRVNCAELSPDGRWLATESGGAFWLWDTARKGERRKLSPGAPAEELVEHLAFDPNGRFLATATRSEVLIWNIADWGKRRSLPATNASLSFSGDGATLATFGEEGIQVWKVGTWERVVRSGEIKVAHNGFQRIALNRDGSLLAASWSSEVAAGTLSSIAGDVALWNVPQRQRLFIEREVNNAQRLAFSDDDRWLAASTLGPPAFLWLWSVSERKPVARWLASQGVGRALAFAPGGYRLATAGSDQVISLWETGNTNRQGLLQGHLSDVCALRFATNGYLVSASDDKTVRLWNIEPARSNPPAFSLPLGRLICPQTADVQRITCVNLADMTFEEWDSESGQLLRQERIQGADTILHHGTLLNGMPWQTGIYRYWFAFDADVQPGVARLRYLIPGPGSPGWGLCASTGDGRVYAWNAESGELVYSNKVASRLLGALPVADHRKLLLAEMAEIYEGPFFTYDLQNHQKELLEEHGLVNPTGMPISPDGRLFACITTNGWVKVWDLTTKQSKRIVAWPALTYVQMAFSPDSRLLAVAAADGWTRVWDVGTGRPVSDRLAGYLGSTSKVNFSADGKSLVTYGADYTAKIWNIATSREMISGVPLNRFLTQHPSWMLLPPDGNSVVESAGERAIRVVRLPSLADIDTAEKRDL